MQLLLPGSSIVGEPIPQTIPHRGIQRLSGSPIQRLVISAPNPEARPPSSSALDNGRRLRVEESGFTLIELLTVLVVIGVLLSVAVPSYLGYKDKANDLAAKANVRSAAPAVEAYYVDNGTYVGMTVAALQTIDTGIKLGTVSSVSASTFCIDATVNGRTWNMPGPAATIAAGACP